MKQKEREKDRDRERNRVRKSVIAKERSTKRNAKIEKGELDRELYTCKYIERKMKRQERGKGRQK